jgi:hypothetical protein
MGIQVNKMNSDYQQNFGANYKVELANATTAQLHAAAFLNKYAKNCEENLELLQKHGIKPDLGKTAINMDFSKKLDPTVKDIFNEVGLKFETIG